MRESRGYPRRHLGCTLLALMQVLPSKIGLWQLSGACQFHNHRTTYAAVHLEDRREAALEVFEARPGSYTAAMRAVMNDVARVAHRGALQIYDVGTLPDGRPYVVRELIDGVTLGTRLEEGPVATNEAVEIMLDVCEVLAAAHEAGVVHRTIDLHHIVLLERGVKLIDWGLSEELRKDADEGWELAPTSSAIDVYSLGVVLHQVLPEMPERLGGLWLAMMAEDPAARPSIRDVAKRLASCIEEAPVVAAELVREPARPVFLKPRNAVALAACAAPMLYFLFFVNHETPEVAAQVAAKPVERAAVAPAPTPAVEPAPAAVTTPEPTPVVTAPVVHPSPPRAKEKTAVDPELLQEYQRVGHELMALEAESSRELLARFRTIHVESATTPEAREAMSALLQELHDEAAALAP